MAQITLAKGINMGLRKAMEDDPKVLVMGEDVGKLGGVFRVTDGLQKDFGEDRVIDTPLAESGIVGTAIGLALRGYRPVCEIQFDGFVYPAFDQIVSQLAKMRARALGKVSLPVVIRIPFGGGIGAVEHHSESNEAYFAHTAGLRVVACSNPVDAYVMIQQAIASDDPVIFYEPKRRYWEKAELDESMTLDQALPMSAARVVREGTDVTVVAYGPMVKTAIEAATAAGEEGTSLEVIDLRSLSPLDMPVAARVGREDRPRMVVVHEAPVFGGLGAEVAARVTEAVLLLARGAGAAGRRLRHALPAEPGRGGLPPRPRPHPRRRRPFPRVLGEPRPDEAGQAMKQFKLPDVGEGLTEAEIVSWKVKPGDTVKVNEIIVEIETAKSLVELPCPFAGTVTDLLVPEGTTVDVGTPIITVDDGSGAAAPPAPAAPPRDDMAPPVAEDPTDPSMIGTPREDEAVEPGLIGGPAPGGRTSVLVGYGPRTTSATRRPRKGAGAPGRDAGGRVRRRGAAGRADVDDDHADAGPGARARARRRVGAGAHRRRPGGAATACGCWPSRRCASWPRTSVSTSER